MKNVKVLGWFNFWSSFNFYNGIVILYFSQVTQSFTLALSLFSLTHLASALGELPTGIYSDSYGRTACLRLGAVAAAGAVGCYALGQSYALLACGALLQGLSLACYSGNNDALLYETLAENQQTEKFSVYYGQVTAKASLAAVVATILGAMIAYWSFSLTLWLSVGPQLLGVLLSLRLIEPSGPRAPQTNPYAHLQGAFKALGANRQLKLLSFAEILANAVGEILVRFLAAFYATLWPIWAIGLARVIQYTGQMVSFHLSGRILQRFEAISVLIFNNILNRLIGIFALLVPTLASPALLASSGFLYGITATARATLLQREFADQQRATLASLNGLLGSICFAGLAPIFGFIADTVGLIEALVVAQLLLLPVIGCYWLLARLDKAYIAIRL
jgi:MFS family permease